MDNLENHWNKIYSTIPEEKLGWYETNLSSTLDLISKSNLDKSARIMVVGAGSSTIVDKLLEIGYSKIIATDLSKVSLNKIKDRISSDKVDFVVDDLTNPDNLLNISPVDLWIDRAVLHFFIEQKSLNTYFDFLKKKVQNKGFVILAEFNLNGAEKCSGLPVQRYNKEMLTEKLGHQFQLLDSFDYTYTTPSGAERPYVYTLFRKK